jgi:Holliday junction DNA helicase RuvA
MIGRLEGRLHHIDPGRVIIDVDGVGYLVSTTLRAVQELAGKDRAALLIHTRVKDDAIELFGFTGRGEIEAFERLIAVAGVGPRTALAVLSTLSSTELAAVVETGDLARLQLTPGVGRKTAERIMLELKGQLEPAELLGPDLRGDAVSALVNLGYPQRRAQNAVDTVLVEAACEDVGEVLRLALQYLTK